MDFLDYLLYNTCSNHVTTSEILSITNGCIRNLEHLHLAAESVLIQGTRIEMKECL
jgi:hypothetical protein